MRKIWWLWVSGFLLIACTARPGNRPIATPTPAVPPPTSAPDITITLSQDGGIAGIHQEWIMSSSGWLILPDSERVAIGPDTVWELWRLIEESGVLAVDQGVSTPVCCDFFGYTLGIQRGESIWTVTYSEGDQTAPLEFWGIVNAFQETVAASEVSSN